MTPKVKICGITRLIDALVATSAGADYIGFVFYEKSKRYIDPKNAKIISNEMKKHNVKTVGVFVDEDYKKINETIKIAKLDIVQLHGKEPVETLNKIPVPVIKNIYSYDEIEKYKDAFALMVDAQTKESPGGTGKVADWEFAQEIKKSNKILMLAGGLNEKNIEDAIKKVDPDIVDISSGVELSPGIKDKKSIEMLFKKINNSEVIK